jgi:hypothetical protein
MYLVVNLANFLKSARCIHEDAERLFLFQRHKREHVQDFYFYI